MLPSCAIDAVGIIETKWSTAAEAPVFNFRMAFSIASRIADGRLSQTGRGGRSSKFRLTGETTFNLCSYHQLHIFRLPSEEVVVVPDLFITSPNPNSINLAL